MAARVSTSAEAALLVRSGNVKFLIGAAGLADTDAAWIARLTLGQLDGGTVSGAAEGKEGNNNDNSVDAGSSTKKWRKKKSTDDAQQHPQGQPPHRDGEDDATAPAMCRGDAKKWKEGWLVKEGGVHRNWRRRWCVLMGEVVYYFKDAVPHANLAGIIRLQENSLVVVAEERLTKRKHCFEVIVLGRTFFIQAAHDQERDEWVKELKEAIKRLRIARRKAQQPEKTEYCEPVKPIGSSVPFFSKLRKQLQQKTDGKENKGKEKDEKEEKTNEKEGKEQEKKQSVEQKKEDKTKEVMDVKKEDKAKGEERRSGKKAN